MEQQTEELAAREIELTRVVDAPVETVFAAFTEAEHLVRWWGPEAFDVTSATSDARAGGAFRIVMRSPDGWESPVEGVYLELDPPHHLVVEASATGPDGTRMLESTTTIDLVDLDGMTEIRLRAAGRALIPEANPALAGMELGWISSLRALDDLVTGAIDRQLLFVRMLEAPRERVFEAWTAPEHVAAWFGPDGFTVTTERMDVRPGGEWIFTMHGPDGVDYRNRVVYEEVEAPERLVYLHGSLPEDEDPPFRVTVIFEDFGGMTVLTMRSVWDTAEARDENVARSGAIDGANQTLDRLTAYLSS